MARLIIVEDNAELATLIAATARSRGHVARAVNTGQAALAALTTGSFDVAVVDLLLPDMKGGDVLSALRDRGVPSIAVSGVYKGTAFAEEAVNVHGARAFFEKPFEMDALLGELEKIAGRPRDAPVEPTLDSFTELEELDPIQEPAADAGLGEWEKTWKKQSAAAKAPPKRAPEISTAGLIHPGTVPRLLNA